MRCTEAVVQAPGQSAVAGSGAEQGACAEGTTRTAPPALRPKSVVAKTAGKAPAKAQEKPQVQPHAKAPPPKQKAPAPQAPAPPKDCNSVGNPAVVHDAQKSQSEDMIKACFTTMRLTTLQALEQAEQHLRKFGIDPGVP